jgi:hypothetical protein
VECWRPQSSMEVPFEPMPSDQWRSADFAMQCLIYVPPTDSGSDCSPLASRSRMSDHGFMTRQFHTQDPHSHIDATPCAKLMSSARHKPFDPRTKLYPHGSQGRPTTPLARQTWFIVQSLISNSPLSRPKDSLHTACLTTYILPHSCIQQIHKLRRNMHLHIATRQLP